MMYQYFVKIVPTIYVKTDGEVSPVSPVLITSQDYIILKTYYYFIFLLQVVKTNQFSVTRHEKVANGLIGDQGLPGVFVLYELSPMMVKFTEKHRFDFSLFTSNKNPVSFVLFKSGLGQRLLL